MKLYFGVSSALTHMKILLSVHEFLFDVIGQSLSKNSSRHIAGDLELTGYQSDRDGQEGEA